MCHIWKIVPDLYEAIINLTDQPPGDPDASSHLAANSSEGGFVGPISNISVIDYILNSNNYTQEYDKLNMDMNLAESQEASVNIPMYETEDLSTSKCADILRAFGNEDNPNSSIGNYSSHIGDQEEAAQQVLQN